MQEFYFGISRVQGSFIHVHVRGFGGQALVTVEWDACDTSVSHSIVHWGHLEAAGHEEACAFADLLKLAALIAETMDAYDDPSVEFTEAELKRILLASDISRRSSLEANPYTFVACAKQMMRSVSNTSNTSTWRFAREFGS